jgi:hypothetical protein
MMPTAKLNISMTKLSGQINYSLPYLSSIRSGKNQPADRDPSVSDQSHQQRAVIEERRLHRDTVLPDEMRILCFCLQCST